MRITTGDRDMIDVHRWVGLGIVARWARKRSHKVKLFALFVCINGSPLIMIDQLVQGMEAPLTDAVECAFNVHSKVFVATRCLQRDTVIADVCLGITNEEVSVMAMLI